MQGQVSPPKVKFQSKRTRCHTKVLLAVTFQLGQETDPHRSRLKVLGKDSTNRVVEADGKGQIDILYNFD
jgi:hypothetical protein